MRLVVQTYMVDAHSNKRPNITKMILIWKTCYTKVAGMSQRNTAKSMHYMRKSISDQCSKSML